MTHLKIEQNNSAIEQVSSAVITKLYELVNSGDLDNTSNLEGRLHTTATYLEYIDGIRADYPNCYITSDNIYIWISDPEVKSVLATRYGDGTNLTAANMMGVTSIQDSLFKSNSNINTFNELGNLNGITSIGDGAFWGSSISLINLDNITNIGERAFDSCSNITSISVPNLTTLKLLAFNNSSITSFSASNEYLTSIPYAAFSECTSLTSLSGLSNVTSIGLEAANRTNLSSIDIDFSKVTSVGANALQYSHLANIDGNFQEMLSVGTYAFDHCTFLNGILSAPKLLTIGNYAFNYTSINSINLPKVLTIGQLVFDECSIGGDMSFPELLSLSNSSFSGAITGSPARILSLGNITNIPLYAFSGCTALTQVVLPNTCTTIEHEAFLNCSNLATMDISNVIKIEHKGLYNCGNLIINNLDVSGMDVGAYAFCNCSHITGTLTIGSDTTLRYDNREGHHFYNTGISSVILPQNLTLIPTDMFHNCSALTSVISSNITNIGWSAFEGCTSLTTIDLSNVTRYSGNGFKNCTSLGTGATLELTHNEASYPHDLLLGTKFTRLIVHMPNATTYDLIYPLHEGMPSLLYLDYSDCILTQFGTTYGDSSIVTWILPSTTNECTWNLVSNLSNLLNMIILAETPPSRSADDMYYFFNDQHGGSANIYVKDSTVRDAYLADAVWSLIPNASTRIKTLAELPTGVWTTGLYQQYEPYLSNH